MNTNNYELYQNFDRMMIYEVLNMTNVRPSSELRNKYNEISSLCKESKSPVIITVNGHGDAVMMSIETYDQMVSELEILKILSTADKQVEDGLVDDIGTTMAKIKQKYNLK